MSSKMGKDYINHRDNFGLTAVNAAVIRGRSGLVKRLLMAGAEIDEDVLMLALKSQSPMSEEARSTIVKDLLSYGADVNFQNDNGRTVLMECLCMKRFELVKVFLDAGADLSIVDKRGNTALILAIASRCPENIVNYLIEGRTNNNRNKRPRTEAS